MAASGNKHEVIAKTLVDLRRAHGSIQWGKVIEFLVANGRYYNYRSFEITDIYGRQKFHLLANGQLGQGHPSKPCKIVNLSDLPTSTLEAISKALRTL
jgi:hypothetical protein